MKVLQKKILMLVISSILITALVVMVISFSNYDRIVESNTAQIMQLICSEKRQEIDEKLLNIEQGVNTLYHFAIGQINDVDDLWQNEEKYEEHISRMKALIETTARYTDGAVSVYYRLEPSIKGPSQGLWLVQNEQGDFEEHEMTDISIYDKDDVEHVGWYYIPIANGKETWIEPYYNQNMDTEMISYVIPIILDDKVIGVVGMDIATSLLYENTKNVRVYETGYAFLMDHKGNFVYHPDMKESEITDDFNSEHKYLYEKSLIAAERKSVETYHWNNIDKRMTAQVLRNGMIFTVCVTEQEISYPSQKMLTSSIMVTVVMMSVFVLVTVSITKVIVRLIYADTMTRVGNKTAYTECIETISKRIKDNEKFIFTVVVVDINDLKKVNDTYGHEYGDQLIQIGADIIKNVWGSEFAYRIGGDEFVIYSETDKEETQKMISLFEKNIEDYNQQNDEKELYLQMAIGMATYNSETDKEYMDVFRRADSQMYENKKIKKDRKK